MFGTLRPIALTLFITSPLLTAGCGTGPSAGASPASELPRVATATPDEQACSRDVECALVEDCCGCAAGGMRTGVRAELLETAVERSAAECEHRSCGSQTSEHRSCEASAARCLGGRCVPAL